MAKANKNTEKREEENFFFKKIVPLLIIIFVISWFFYSYNSQGIVYSIFNLNYSSVIDFIDSFGHFAALIFVALVILEVVLAIIPPVVLYVAGGIIFGPLIGGTLSLAGNIIGAFIAFKIARSFGKGFIEDQINKKTEKRFDKFSQKHGVFAIFLLRVNPLTTSDLFSYLAGLTKMKTGRFLLATTLGLAPLVYLQSYFGGFLQGNTLLISILILVSFVLIVVIAYLLIEEAIRRRVESNS